MIKGTGIDIIELERIQKMMEQQSRFVERILTSVELTIWNQLAKQRQIEFLAGRFAAKEALAKALGSGIGSQFTWHDVSIVPSKSGAPEMMWHDAKQAKVYTYYFHLSISHCKHYAVAQVIIEEKN